VWDIFPWPECRNAVVETVLTRAGCQDCGESKSLHLADRIISRGGVSSGSPREMKVTSSAP
jgi:hypothetical protein